MALDRDTIGLLFKIDANTADARQQLDFFQGVVDGISSEIRDQFSRMSSSVSASFDGAAKSLNTFAAKLSDTATSQIRSFLGQFGAIGDVAADMIPSLSGSSAAMMAFAGTATIAGTAMVGAAFHAMDYGGQIDDLAQTTNLTTDTLQSLRLAATLSGQSFEDVSQSTIIFQKQIEAAKNGNKDLAYTFQQLGVDLNGPVDEAFRRTLESMGRVEEDSVKTATTLELFGRSGAKLLPVMNEVGGSFDGLVDRAKQYGLVLDKETIAKTAELGDKWDLLKLRMSAFTTTIGIGVLDFFNNVAIGIGVVTDKIKSALPDLSKYTSYISSLFGKQAEPGADAATIARLEAIDQGTKTPAGTITLQRAEKAKASTAIAKKAKEDWASIYEADLLRQEVLIKARKKILDDEAQAIEINLERENTYALAKKRILDNEAQAIEDSLADENTAILARKKILDDEAQAIEDELMRIEQRIEAARTRQKEAAAKHQAELEADPSSMLSIFGKKGQEAADEGKGLFGVIGASAGEALADVSKQMGNFKTMMVDVFSGVANGLQSMIQGFIMTGKLGSAAFKQMAAQIISAVVAQSAVKAIFELAEGFAASARYDYASAAQHFTSAKFYGVVAGVAAAGAIGLAAIGPGGSGSNGQFLTSDRGTNGTRTIEQGMVRRNEPQVVIIRAETEPGVVVSKVIQDYKSNGEIRNVMRRDLLGEF